MNPLLKKALAQNIALLLIIGIPLFLAAGAFDYPRLWTFTEVIIAFSVTITAYMYFFRPALLKRRLSGLKGEKQETQMLVRRGMSLLLLVLLIVAGLDNRYGWSTVSSAAVTAAYALIFTGFVIYFLTVRENVFASSIIEVEQEQKVVATGPYSIVRHPMYAALTLIFIGMPVALGSWYGLLISAPLVAILAARLLDEERLLRADLPGYADYCRQIRYRLVPCVW